jgi:hypothetical protein
MLLGPVAPKLGRVLRGFLSYKVRASSDLEIAIESIDRSKHRRVTALSFSIKPKTETAR